MKKIFIMAYLRNNLGDDLFVKELINRYPNEKFYIDVIDLKYGEVFRNSKNVEVRIEKEENFNKIEINQYDAFIYIINILNYQNKLLVVVQISVLGMNIHIIYSKILVA